jgi:DNA-binding response OmpR family regulator
LGPASSVDQALDLLKSQRPDAAVLDVTLGGEKVTPVAVLLKQWGVPFVLASASDPAELARHDVLANVLNLGKPTDMERLVEVVRSL